MRVERSPRATAVVTAAILRTWLVRFDAIEFTDSVRSFHVPATPLRTAWPPSLPSDPTSRATRVTSEAKELSWSTIVLTTRAVRRLSPLSGRPSTSSAMVWERSPFATAPITRATSVEGWTRSPMRLLTESTHSDHCPKLPPRDARCWILPSFPTELLTRASSRAIFSLSSRTSLRVSTIFPDRPVVSTVIRTEKLPLLNAVRTFRSSFLSRKSATGCSVFIQASKQTCYDGGSERRKRRGFTGAVYYRRRISNYI